MCCVTSQDALCVVLSPGFPGKFTSRAARSGHGARRACAGRLWAAQSQPFAPGHSSLELQEPWKADCPLDLGLQTADPGSCQALPECFCVVDRCAVPLLCYMRRELRDHGVPGAVSLGGFGGGDWS